MSNSYIRATPEGMSGRAVGYVLYYRHEDRNHSRASMDWKLWEGGSDGEVCTIFSV